MTRVCVVGLGHAGRLHRQLLAAMDAQVVTVDPVPDDGARADAADVDDVPDAGTVDMWSVCTPTSDHLSTVRRILQRDPGARILVEKPLCLPGEIEAFTEVEAAHPAARLILVDQYRFARAAADARTAWEEALGGSRIRRIRVAFTKDREPDVAQGRFVDDVYGVFGYEWIHMLALLGHVLPGDVLSGYLCGPVAASRITSPDGGATTAWERTVLADDCEMELFSTVDDPGAAHRGDTPGWVSGFAPGPGRRRRVLDVATDRGSWTVEFDPVVLRDGRWLGRNRHRITLRSPGGSRQRVVSDSVLNTMLASALAADRDSAAALDTLPTKRLAAIAGSCRSAPLPLSMTPQPHAASVPEGNRS